VNAETSNTADTAQEAADVAARAKATKAYASQSRESLEEKWILDYLPLVRHVVQKVTAQFPRHVDLDNLVSAGTLGLVKAARSFSYEKGVEFKIYAYIRIKGAVIDELRGESFTPPNVRAEIRAVRKAWQNCCQANGSPPSDDELAAALGLTPSELYHTLEEARRQQFLSINGLGDGGRESGRFVPADASPTPAAQAERLELVERLTAAIRELPTRDRHVLLLYYERDLTMKEIAKVLDITESRVSQLHASALFKLSMKIKD
jgi:RNA polymerase sigma factor for flagellar operon FliA